MAKLQNLMHRKSLRRMALGWCLLVLLACLYPGEELPETDVPLADKWVHFVLFGIQAVLVLLALARPTGKKILLSVLACVGFGLVVEILQGLTHRWLQRAFDPMDMVANTIGVAIGVLVFLLLRKRKFSAALSSE